MPRAYLQIGAPTGDTETYRDGCTGKVPFASPALAADIATRGNRGPKGKGETKNREVYRCRACNFWHLGKMAPRDRRRLGL